AALPLTPALAIKPNATDVSSRLYPNAPATGATILKASPSPETSVLALDDAAAITSAYLPASLAASPKALMESVKISDTRPKSSPDAAARFSTPSIPSKDCCTSQPASDMYLKPSVTSFALNLVD